MRLPDAISTSGSRVVFCAASLLLVCVSFGMPARIATPGELAGDPRQYAVQKGDSLLSISRRFYTDPKSLLRLNPHLKGRIRTGVVLKLPSFNIIPASTYEGIVLNIPERALYLFRGGRLARRFPVAVGMKSWPTPTGRHEIHMKLKNPVWITPSEMVRREGAAPAALTVRSQSPLGDRWMGWCEVGPNESEVGFHGTNDVASIGTLASHACVRLYPEHARELFEAVYEGMAVHSLYEPIKIGRQTGITYLSVSPDIYGRKKNTLARVLQLLRQVGIRNPSTSKLKYILARQDGFPYRISNQ